MLSAAEVTSEIARGELAWPGELRGDGLLLRLGSPLQPLAAPDPATVINLTNQASIDSLYQAPLPDWQTYDLGAGRLVLAAVEYPLRVGTGLAGAIATLSHLARVGLATHITSPWVLPGWVGRLTLEILNCGPATLRLTRGMPVARLVLFRLGQPATAPAPHPHYGYGHHLGSRYAEEFGPTTAPRGGQ